MVRKVFGIAHWPEEQGNTFPILRVNENETDEEAIARAQAYYSVDLQCYVADVEE
jgi:hypothetical protein